MKIRNITEKNINVNTIGMQPNEIKEFSDEFKKTQEFKNLVEHKYIEETEEEEENNEGKE